MEWILRLAAAGGEGPCVDIMEIGKPEDFGDIANLGLTLAEAKQLLARVQCEISTAQASVMLPLTTGPLIVADQDLTRAGNSGTSR